MSTGLRLLIETDVGALLQESPPANCPFAMPTDEQSRLRLLTLQQVPERLRALLHTIAVARSDLNKMKGIELQLRLGMNSSEVSKNLELAARTLDDQLRREVGLVDRQIIEYEADWRFSVTTLEEERGRYAASSAEEQDGKEETGVGGPVKNWTDEPRWHLQFADARFDQALAQTRRKAQKRKEKKRPVA